MSLDPSRGNEDGLCKLDTTIYSSLSWISSTFVFLTTVFYSNNFNNYILADSVLGYVRLPQWLKWAASVASNSEVMWVLKSTHALASYTACIIKSRTYHECRTIGPLNEIYFSLAINCLRE